jgi:hypothetical protein
MRQHYEVVAVLRHQRIAVPPCIRRLWHRRSHLRTTGEFRASIVRVIPESRRRCGMVTARFQKVSHLPWWRKNHLTPREGHGASMIFFVRWT